MGVRLILASQSPFRRAMLTSAGIDFESRSSTVDETSIKNAFEGRDGAILAEKLAVAKARDVARREPDAWSIGCDQVLSLDGTLFDKPRSRDEARLHLTRLRGKTHALISAVTIVQNETVLWSHCETAHLTMRQFSDAFVESYLDAVGNDILQTVGCYMLEGRGIQLFSSVKGDYFTIIGLPLLPLLCYLRDHAVLDK